MRLMPKNSEAWTLWLPACHALLFQKRANNLGAQMNGISFPPHLESLGRYNLRAVVIENVRGILDAVFEDYRRYIATQLPGYWTDWHLLNASDYGVSQLRPRVNFVAIRRGLEHGFRWPDPIEGKPSTVGELLYDLMAVNGMERSSKMARQCF